MASWACTEVVHEFFRLKSLLTGFFCKGSDLHFSCGSEVRIFRTTKNSVSVSLKKNYRRDGFIFLFIPRVDIEHKVKVTVNGNERGMWNVVGNVPHRETNGSPRLVGRVIRVAILIHGDGRRHDGEAKVDF